MKTLVLLRHIKSSKLTALPDFDRTISAERRSDMQKVTAALQKTGFLPEHIISSPAMRTKQTAAAFCDDFGINPGVITYKESLYEASVGDILNVLNEIPDEAGQIVIVGHNPSMTEAANEWSNAIVDQVPTCAAVGIGFEGDTWKSAIKTRGQLLFFFAPKLL